MRTLDLTDEETELILEALDALAIAAGWSEEEGEIERSLRMKLTHPAWISEPDET